MSDGTDSAVDTDSHSDADADADADGDTDSAVDTDSCSDADADSDTDSAVDTDSRSDADADSDTDSAVDTDSRSDADSDGNTDSDSDTITSNDSEIPLDSDFIASDCVGGRYDPLTNLCWQNPKTDRKYDQDSWQDAVDYCETLSLGGFDDWTVPTKEELLELLGDCSGDCRCNSCAESIRCTTVLGEDSSDYWSSTAPDYGSGDAWTVNFQDGTCYYNYGMPSSYSVRCVRYVQ